MEPYAPVSLALAGLSLLLALFVLGVYWRNHRTIASPFTLAFLLFAAFTLLHSALVAYEVLVTMPTLESSTRVFRTIELSLQTAALGALAWATTR